MLPSCGHFKNIPCPFYKLALCVRPHCPYKHQCSENGHQRQIFTPLVDDTESLFDSKVNLSVILPKSSYTSVIETQNATYIPTPVETSSRPPGILKSSSSIIDRPSSSFVPEYKPTPISKLKEYSATSVNLKSVKSEYVPEFPITMRKKKNVEEYDPTEVKCIPKKTVTFVDQIDLSSDVPVILLSSDEDLDDADDNAPKFSDDDVEDEDTPSVPKFSMQVPEERTIIKEELSEEEVPIDEFSVVDKIIVECKKNNRLLNPYQKLKLLPKPPSDVISKNISVSKHDKNVLSQTSDSKNHKNYNNIVIKDEQDLLDLIDTKDTKEDKTNIKSKTKKDENSDLASNSSKEKKSTHKKELKTERKEPYKEKVHKTITSHSSQNKEKIKKDSKESDKSKHSKKMPLETKNTSSVDNKSSKSSRHLNTESHDKKDIKKKVSESHNVKHDNSASNFDKKKSKHEDSTNNLDRKRSKPESSKIKNLEPVAISNKEKSLPSKLSLNSKRKSNDSDCEQQPLKNKSQSPIKKLKSENTQKSKPTSSDVEQSKFKVDNSLPEVDNDDSFMDEYISSSDSDPDEECRRIFNECYPENSEPTKKEKKEEEPKQNVSKTSDAILRKKRLAHSAASLLKKAPNKIAKTEMKRPLPPAQVMFNRFAQCQAKFALENKGLAKAGADKKRISCVPNESMLAALKNKANQSNPALSNFSPLPPTVTKSLKVTHRTAHIPEVAMKPRPIIPSGYGNKVPSNLRQKFLNAFIDECLKFCPSEDEAYEMGLEEEKKVYDRISSKALYMNVAANTLNRLRRQAEEGPQDSGSNSASSKDISKPEKRTVSHEALLNGPLAQRRSFSIGRKKEAPEIKGGAALYEYLLTYILTPEQLKENSYPLPHPTERDRAVIDGVYANRVSYCNDAFKRECCRCHKTYYVNVDGDYVRDEECDFHWGRIWKKRIAGSFESRYNCCQGDAESDGCCVSAGHVFEGSESHALKGFVKTLPKTPPRDNCYGIYALDCEMCYTTAGMELTRVTVVDTDLKTVYESFVKPKHKVLDYNTRFSGITEDDLKNVRTSILDVQAVLLCIFNDKTILIGHSLESDFKALKLFHSTVIDTTVVFPHKNGLPFKRALKTLMAEKLNKIIQNDVGGHDSQEDAAACMELMLWKVKEDLRGNR